MTSMISYSCPDGQSVSAYVAEPEGGGPGVVVLREWWGLDDQIRGVADRLALAGYVALVPDLYRGKSTVETEEAQHLMGNLNFANETAAGPRRFPFTQYDPVWAQIAWDRTLRFFGRHLG